MTDHSLIEHLLTLLPLSPDETDAASPAASKTAEKIKNFLEEIPGGFFIYRADTEQILFANRAILHIFECENFAQFSALTGKTFRGMVHPDDVEAVEKSISDQINSGNDNMDYVEYRIVTYNGNIRMVEDYGHFVHSKTAGDIFYVFISDATEKITRNLLEQAENKKKERKLRNLIEEYDKERQLVQREHLRRLEVIEGLSINYESIIYTDLDADTALPYRLSTRLVKQFAQKLKVLPFRALVKEYADTWIHPDDRAAFIEQTSPDYIRRKLKDSTTFYFNYRVVEGEVKYIQMRVVDVGGGDTVNQIVMGYRNVDEEMLQELKQKQLLESALRAAQLADVAKNTFLSNMSHDMRTPLNALFGYTALARRNALKGEDVLPYLDKIETAGRQMLDLIQSVLEISYTESLDFRVREEPCRIDALLQEITEPLRIRAEQKGLRLSVHTDGLRHVSVLADADKLRQLLGHLTSNAVKYTPKGGNVHLSVREHTGTQTDFSTYEFCVQDNGIGIEKEWLERIFQPFERVQNTTAGGEFGTGLGLTIARRLSDSMGGKIEVESAPEKGSTFTFTVGLRLQCGETAAESAELGGKHVLLVEDNEINREIETDLLGDLGYTVDTAENGQIAVEKAQSADYDFILMDIQMPVMDGRTATREIRKLPDAKRAGVPIIALSANAFESDRRASLECGMDAHLNKPLDLNELQKTLSGLIGR